MKTIAILYALYFFMCYIFGSKPTAEGMFLPVIISGILAVFSVAKSNREVSIYFSKDQIEEMIEEDD